MRLAYVQWHWAVLQTFRAWGRVVAETPLEEPVIVVDDDRLVLRRVDRRFWTAANCATCAAPIARVDLAAHQQTCAGPRPSAVRLVHAAAGGAATLPSRLPAAAGNARTVVVPAPRHRRQDLHNRSLARVFGQRPAVTGGLLMAAIGAMAAAIALGAVLASEFPSQAMDWFSQFAPRL